MANYASVIFYTKNPEPQMSLSGLEYKSLHVQFDGAMVMVTTTYITHGTDYLTKNIFTPPSGDYRPYFARRDGYFDGFKDDLTDVLNYYYQNVLNLKLHASYSFDSLSGSWAFRIDATEYGHSFAAGIYNSMPNFEDPIFIAEELPLEFKITAQDPTTGQNGVDRKEYCTYYISEENGVAPCTLKTVPALATNVRFQYGSIVAFEYLRSHNQPLIELKDASDNITVNSINLKRVKKWQISTVQVTDTTITILADGVGLYDYDTTITYSLDGSLFQASNQFTILPAGTYTAYVLDSLGGLWEKEFEVIEAVSRVAPFIDFSDANALQFFDVSESNNYLSLFRKQNKFNLYDVCFAQTLKSNTLITSQFRSSYEDHEVKIGTTIYPVTKKVKNIGLKDWRDCEFVDGGNNKTHVYFAQGQVYDPETGAQLSNYDNNTIAGSSLAEWQVEGVIMLFTFGQFICSDIVYNSTIEGMAMVIDTPFLSFQPEICKSTYNAEDWDVYEFTIDTSTLEKNVELKIEVNTIDSLYPKETWESDTFVVDNYAELILIEYWTNNRTIGNLIPTGIVNRMYLKSVFHKYEPQTDIESFTDDMNNTIEKKRTYQRVLSIESDAVAQYMAHKFGLAMLFENILINGLPFVPNGEMKVVDFTQNNNPLCTIAQQFVPKQGAATSVTDAQTTQRVLGASTQSILGV